MECCRALFLSVLSVSLSLAAGRDVTVKRYGVDLGTGRDASVKRYGVDLDTGRDESVKRYEVDTVRDAPVKRYGVDLDTGRDAPLKRFVVNLDTAPEDHFIPMCQDPYIQELLPMMREDVKNTVLHFVPAEVLPLLEVLAADLDRYLPHPFAGELRSFANCTGNNLGEIVALNLMYDLTVFCTSIVAQDSNGTIWHGRNMDFGFSNFLRNITILVDFQSKGQTLYTTTTFLGYVGALTGQRPDKFTVSVDMPERKKGSWWMNALEALLNRRAKVTSFLVRETLAEADSYDVAVQKLADTPLIAPVYFIVGGANAGEGAVITRARTSARDIWKLNPEQGRWYVLETNYDRSEEPPADDDRRTPARKAMNTTGQAGINAASMFHQVLSVNPVLNEITIYTAIMSAAQPHIYNSWVRWPEGQAAGRKP